MRDAARFNIRGASFPFTPTKVDVRQLHPREFVERFTPRLATYFVAVFLVFTGFGVFFAPLPAYLSGVGYGSSEIFGLYLVLNVGAAVFYGSAATLAGRYELTRVHIGGLTVRGFTLPLIAVLVTLFGKSVLGLGAVTFAFLIIGMTWAIIVVTAATLVTTLAPAIIRGEALGVYGALTAVGGGVGGLLGGAVAAVSYMTAFGIAGVLVLTGAGVVGLLSRRPAHFSASRTESA